VAAGVLIAAWAMRLRWLGHAGQPEALPVEQRTTLCGSAMDPELRLVPGAAPTMPLSL
jgi:hypothetical protein